MYYKICERCGAHLEPDETCSCEWLDDPDMEMCQARRRPNRRGYEMDSYAKEAQDHAYDHA